MFEKNFLIECAEQLQINESRLYIDNDNIESNVYSNNSGNFNVDVLEVALGKKNFTLSRLIGKIEVLPVGMFILCNGAHWYAFRRFLANGPLWNLDSLLSEPEIINDVINLSEGRISIFVINFY